MEREPHKKRKTSRAKTTLQLPDLEDSKKAVVASLGSESSPNWLSDSEYR